MRDSLVMADAVGSTRGARDVRIIASPRDGLVLRDWSWFDTHVDITGRIDGSLWLADGRKALRRAEIGRRCGLRLRRLREL